MITMKSRSLEVVILTASLTVVCSWGQATKTLHFPPDQYTGRLSVEDPCLGSEFMELGRDFSLPLGLDPKRVALGGDWDFVARAQGDVSVPGDRNVKLVVVLEPLKADAYRLSDLSRRYLSDKVITDPEDLSGLSGLAADDLYSLRVSSLVRRRDADKRILEPISHLTGLQILGLSQTGVTDQQIGRLALLRSLRALELGQEFSLGNAGLAVLRDLPELQYLDLDTGATDAGLRHLGQLQNLRWLRLRTGKIRGAGLAELARAPRLERLCLWGTTGLSDRHISHLEGLTQIKSLTLWGSNLTLTDISLASIAKLTSLEELYFIRVNTRFSGAGIGYLEPLRNLRKVSFSFCRLGAEGLQHLANLPRLESLKGLAPTADAARVLPSLGHLKALDINWVIPPIGTPVPPEVVAAVGQLRSVEDLAVMGGQWSQEDLLVFGKLSNLKRLRLGMRDDYGDAVLAEIARLKELEHLSLSGKAVSKRGLNQLNALTNLRTLSVSTRPDAESGIDETPLNLSGLTNLKTLSLNGFALQDSDLASVAGMRDLEWLALQSGPPSEAALVYLKDLTKLKRLHLSNLTCTTGSGLAWLAGLKEASSIRLHGRITDAALRQMPVLPELWSLRIETDEVIQPETVAKLRARLPAIEHIHIDEPMHFGGPPPVRIRGSDTGGRPSSNQRTPRARRRR